MQIEQTTWTTEHGWNRPEPPGTPADLVLVFGGRRVLEDPDRLNELRQRYPAATLLGCSTAGEICGTRVLDDTLVATAVRFTTTRVAGAMVRIGHPSDSKAVGERLGSTFDSHNLKHVFVLSDGVGVNGSELVRGLTASLPAHVTVTGGLSGDGSAFQKTVIVWNDEVSSGAVAALGFYGPDLHVGWGCLGGWDPFGPERLITRSSGNVLFELDGRSALGLYKQYLGEHAAGLPATGLLFPLSVRGQNGETGVVRTILSVDEADQSLTFAGDVPEGAYARLMKANFDRLVDGAVGAARTSRNGSPPELAVLISCVGRKLILKQRVEDEVDGVREALGASTVLTGFYSYGEISPFSPHARCELHNQTMTVTTFTER